MMTCDACPTSSELVHCYLIEKRTETRIKTFKKESDAGVLLTGLQSTETMVTGVKSNEITSVMMKSHSNLRWQLAEIVPSHCLAILF